VWRFLLAGGVGKWGRVETHVERHVLGPLQSRAFITLLLVCVCFCASLSCNELVFTAFTQAIGLPGAVGWLYFVACVSSAVASLMFGTRTFAWPLSRLLSVFTLYTAATFAMMALATSFWGMMVLAFLSGAAVGPGIASLYTLAGQYSQSRYITEAMTWMISTLLVGLGIGLAMGGWAIDAWGWQWTAVFSAGPAVVAAFIALSLPAPAAKPIVA
jgi:MFS family permease